MKKPKSNCVPRSFYDIFSYHSCTLLSCITARLKGRRGDVTRCSPYLPPPLEPCCRIKRFSTPHNLFVHGGRPPVPHYGPFIQSMNISQARNCWKKSAGRTSGFLAPLGISTQWTFFPTPVNKVQCKFKTT